MSRRMTYTCDQCRQEIKHDLLEMTIDGHGQPFHVAKEFCTLNCLVTWVNDQPWIREAQTK